jgi:hypothetical protein
MTPEGAAMIRDYPVLDLSNSRGSSSNPVVALMQ